MSPASAASLRSAARIALTSGIALAGLAILALRTTPAQAAEPLAFTIPAEDGYGIADCMQAGSTCGQAMAASWCEAHGHAHVAAFGMSDDVTGSIGAPVVPAGHAVIIRCDD